MTLGIIFGVWDLFHEGHVNVLREAKNYCDKLVVAVFTDDAIEKYKRKPILSALERMEVVQSCKYVDLVIVIDRKPLPSSRVDVYFVSDKLKGKKLYCVPTNRMKDIIYLPYTEDISTTIIIKRIQDEVLKAVGK